MSADHGHDDHAHAHGADHGAHAQGHDAHAHAPLEEDTMLTPAWLPRVGLGLLALGVIAMLWWIRPANGVTDTRGVIGGDAGGAPADAATP